MIKLLPLLLFVTISSYASDTIFVDDNYADRSMLFDNSLLLLWGTNLTPTSAFEIKNVTDGAGLALKSICATVAASPYSTYYDSVSHKPSLKTATCYDYILQRKIDRSAKKITIEFDAIWNKYNIPRGEAGRVVITLVINFTTVAPKFGDIDSAHQERFGYPAYNLRILNSGSSSNQTFMVYGGGKTPNGEFEKRTENGRTYWLPGFSSEAGGTSPGQPDSSDYPYFPTKKSNKPFIQAASITEWRHFTWIIEPEYMQIFKRATNENESMNELVSSMLIPKYEGDSLDVINKLNNEYGTNISKMPKYYKWFSEFNSVRVYLKATSSNFGYIANF